MCNVVQFQQRADDYLGLCPKCHKSPNILNIGSSHFAICKKHKLYWGLGSNQFSAWREESKVLWEKNADYLNSCRAVDEFYWPESEAS